MSTKINPAITHKVSLDETLKRINDLMQLVTKLCNSTNISFLIRDMNTIKSLPSSKLVYGIGYLNRGFIGSFSLNRKSPGDSYWPIYHKTTINDIHFNMKSFVSLLSLNLKKKINRLHYGTFKNDKDIFNKVKRIIRFFIIRFDWQIHQYIKTENYKGIEYGQLRGYSYKCKVLDIVNKSSEIVERDINFSNCFGEMESKVWLSKMYLY